MSKKYVLRHKYVLAEGSSNSVKILGGPSVLEICCKNNHVKKWLLNLKVGIDTSSLNDCLSSDEILELTQVLLSKGLIREFYSNEYINTPYEKHIPLFAEYFDDPNSVQNELFNKHVLIVGLGGVGQVVLRHLVALGINNFTLVDHDTVQLNNLNRQFIFDSNDLDLPKLEAISQKVRKINKSSSIREINSKVTTESDILNKIDYKVDLIVCAADTPPIIIRDVLTSISIKLKCPITFGSVGLETGSWGPFLDKDRDKEKYLNHLNKLKNYFDGNKIDNIPMSIGYTNTLISTFLSMDITRYFLGQEVHSLKKKLQLNFSTLKIDVREEF